MWPELIPLIGEYAVPLISGLTTAGQTLSQTGDPLKALLAGGGTAAGGIGLGKVGAGLGGKVARMAGNAVDAPGLAGLAAQAISKGAQPVGQYLGQTWGGNLAAPLASSVAGVVPSVGSVANAALGGGGLLSNATQPRPTGKVSAYQPPDISPYGPNGIYGALAMENPLGAAQEARRYAIELAQTQDIMNKITTPYAREQARQAYEEELQRQAASYQQKSGLDTAAAMLKQAQYAGQQAGVNAQQAINNAISGPQRSYF